MHVNVATPIHLLRIAISTYSHVNHEFEKFIMLVEVLPKVGYFHVLVCFWRVHSGPDRNDQGHPLSTSSFTMEVVLDGGESMETGVVGQETSIQIVVSW